MSKQALHISAAMLEPPAAPILEPVLPMTPVRHALVCPLEVFHNVPAQHRGKLFAGIEKAAREHDLERLLDKLAEWAAASYCYAEMQKLDHEDTDIIGYDPVTGEPIYDWPDNMAMASTMITARTLGWDSPEEDEAWRDL
jgi:hypothetical protein